MKNLARGLFILFLFTGIFFSRVSVFAEDSGVIIKLYDEKAVEAEAANAEKFYAEANELKAKADKLRSEEHRTEANKLKSQIESLETKADTAKYESTVKPVVEITDVQWVGSAVGFKAHYAYYKIEWRGGANQVVAYLPFAKAKIVIQGLNEMKGIFSNDNVDDPKMETPVIYGEFPREKTSIQLKMMMSKEGKKSVWVSLTSGSDFQGFSLNQERFSKFVSAISNTKKLSDSFLASYNGGNFSEESKKILSKINNINSFTVLE